MNTDFTQELAQLQLSRSRNNKYAHLLNDYIDKLPGKLSAGILKPVTSVNNNVSALVRFRGKMLFSLEQRLSASWDRLRNLSK